MRKLTHFLTHRDMSPIKVLTVSWLLSLLLLPVAGSIVWSMYQSYNQHATKEFRLQQLVGEIVHLNDVLTSAARMASITGDKTWEERYREVEPKLDGVINEAAILARESYEKSYAAKTKSAYSALIEMECLALTLVQGGRREEASKILFSPEYEVQKKLYSEGIGKMASAIQDRVQKNMASLNRRMISIGVLGFIIVAVLLGVWLAVVIIVRMQLTQRRLAEEALSRSETKFRNLVHNAPLGIFLCDSDGSVSQTNPMLGKIFPSLAREDPHGIFTLDPAFLKRAHFADTLTRCVNTGETIVSEFPYTLEAGDFRYVRAHLSPHLDDQGGIEGIQGVVEDCTERKKAEIRLQRTHRLVSAEARKLRSLIEGIEEGVIFANADDVVTEANSWIIDRLEVTKDRVIGRSLWALGLEKEFSLSLPTLIQDYRKGRVTDAQVFNLKWKDLHVSCRLYPMFDSASYRGLILNIIDVTEISRSKERAELADRSKSQFLANMSHEIRTPMNAIIGMAELAMSTPLTAVQREYLDTIQMSAHSLLALINDILDFSKIEAGKLELHPSDLNLRDHVCSTVQTLAAQAHSKGLELACRIAPSIPDALIGDSDRIRQILVNLVGNAVKFTSEGEIVVQVELESRNEDHVYLHWSVSDTGIGIPFDKQKLIFSAFEQADGSTSRQYGGTGLGLAITSQLVELMGGRIWVESAVRKGSTFHFTFPLAIQHDPVVPNDLSLVDMIKGLRVLVVDDNATNRRILEELLKHWAMTPTVTPSGKEALTILEEGNRSDRPFALAIVDCMMPEMDGFEVVARIRDSVDLKNLKILMLTSANPVAPTESMDKLGVDACLLKPIHQSNLYNTILKVMRSDAVRSPLKPPEASNRIPESAQALRILLAEDNVFNQKVAVGMLTQMGHSVSVVGNGQEAVRSAKTGHFDLILMDVQMPLLDGFQATRLIREVEQDSGRRTPIVAMTAYAMKGDREKCLEAGMDAYLSKPINIRELSSLIDNVTANLGAGPCTDDEDGEREKVLDLTFLLQVVGGNRELLQEMLTIFNEDCPKLMSDLEAAVDSRDAKQVGSAAHTLKSMLGGLGAHKAQEIALRLEAMGRSSDLTHAVDVLRELAKEVGKVEESLRNGGKEISL